MKARIVKEGPEKTYVLVFETGDEVMNGLQAFATRQGMKGGHLTAIGALSEAVLGYFDWETRKYAEIPVAEQVEVVSMMGDVAMHKNIQQVHAHLVVSTEDGSALGGHLLKATVRPTLEVILTETPEYLRRRMDERSGLPLLALEDHIGAERQGVQGERVGAPSGGAEGPFSDLYAVPASPARAIDEAA